MIYICMLWSKVCLYLYFGIVFFQKCIEKHNNLVQVYSFKIAEYLLFTVKTFLMGNGTGSRCLIKST